MTSLQVDTDDQHQCQSTLRTLMTSGGYTHKEVGGGHWGDNNGRHDAIFTLDVPAAAARTTACSCSVIMFYAKLNMFELHTILDFI